MATSSAAAADSATAGMLLRGVGNGETLDGLFIVDEDDEARGLSRLSAPGCKSWWQVREPTTASLLRHYKRQKQSHKLSKFKIYMTLNLSQNLNKVWLDALYITQLEVAIEVSN